MSPGCDHCYAERMAKRLQAMGNPRYTNGFAPTLHWDKVSDPLKWRQPRRIFVNSMSDLFHEAVPADFVRAVFDTMAGAHWHEFQVLTKRARRLPKIAEGLVWPANVWLGVSVESREYAWRADYLRRVPAAVRFLSVEPLVGPVGELELDKIDWVIVGGESGPGARPMDVQWARAVRDQCVAASVPFFFKQWGGVRKHRPAARSTAARGMNSRWRQQEPKRRAPGRCYAAPFSRGITSSASNSPTVPMDVRRSPQPEVDTWTSAGVLRCRAAGSRRGSGKQRQPRHNWPQFWPKALTLIRRSSAVRGARPGRLPT